VVRRAPADYRRLFAAWRDATGRRGNRYKAISCEIERHVNQLWQFSTRNQLRAPGL